MKLTRKFDECQEAFLVKKKKKLKNGEGYTLCRSSEACQVGYGFAHGLTKFV